MTRLELLRDTVRQVSGVLLMLEAALFSSWYTMMPTGESRAAPSILETVLGNLLTILLCVNAVTALLWLWCVWRVRLIVWRRARKEMRNDRA